MKVNAVLCVLIVKMYFESAKSTFLSLMMSPLLHIIPCLQ